MASMTVKELSKKLGFTELATRELIKAGKFEYFAWAWKSEGKKRWNIEINKERFELFMKGFDLELLKKALDDLSKGK